MGGRRRGLVEGEGELHAFDGARVSVLVRFPGALLLGDALADDVHRVVAFEAGSLELFDASTSTENAWTV